MMTTNQLINISNLLISGYGRKHNISSIPNDIVQTISTEWSSIIHNYEWNIFNSDLNVEPRHAMHSSAFQIHGIVFELSLYPNGEYNYSKGFTRYALSIKFIPSNILSFVMCYHLYCKSISFHFKNTQKISHRTIKIDGHPPFQINYAEFINLDSISFGCSIDILQIDYINNDKYDKYEKMIKMCRNIGGLQCKLDVSLLKQFEFISKKKEIYSTNIDRMNGNFCFIIGYNYKLNVFYIDIKLLRMPFGVKSMRMQFNLRYIILNGKSYWKTKNIFYRGYDRVIEIFKESTRIQLDGVGFTDKVFLTFEMDLNSADIDSTTNNGICTLSQIMPCKDFNKIEFHHNKNIKSTQTASINMINQNLMMLLSLTMICLCFIISQYI